MMATGNKSHTAISTTNTFVEVGNSVTIYWDLHDHASSGRGWMLRSSWRSVKQLCPTNTVSTSWIPYWKSSHRVLKLAGSPAPTRRMDFTSCSVYYVLISFIEIKSVIQIYFFRNNEELIGNKWQCYSVNINICVFNFFLDVNHKHKSERQNVTCCFPFAWKFLMLCGFYIIFSFFFFLHRIVAASRLNAFIQ